ncbi:hypothetical protein BK659_13790 [Pseudomonas brassicacearum]|uniref:DUF3077 domain-containing protein n=1 Tax=Pseudomonas brassicacearum TaxID=930166 RepID=A0A423H5L5_9PSED|nr:DUF6124 family protein [Pseudomonas brassicacearum]RON08465.1 hypothetical protein BK659_13790 [Pseudomonas brassicacearum]
MKKNAPNPPETPAVSDPTTHVFTIAPNIDTETLLIHTSETLASLNAMTTDLAFELEGSRRNVALAMQQLVVLSELLVNRALEHFDTPDSASGVSSAARH